MDSSKVIVLHFKTQVSTWFRTREPDLKTKKLDLWLRPWSLTPSCNLDLEPLGPCNSEPLKQSKSSRSQIFFETSSLKDFTIFTGKHLCWGLVLVKLQAFNIFTDSNSGVSCGYCKIFKNIFFYRKPPVAASDSPTTVK